LDGDITIRFNELWEVISDGKRFMVFTTESSIYCCSNSGEFTVLEKKDLGAVKNQIIIPSPILELMYEYQNHKDFSGRIYILKGSEYISLIFQAKEKRVFARKCDGVIMIFTNTGSLYFHIR
jgi:hypothetical protein